MSKFIRGVFSDKQKQQLWVQLFNYSYQCFMSADTEYHVHLCMFVYVHLQAGSMRRLGGSGGLASSWC